MEIKLIAILFAPTIAVLLDFLLGDPTWLYHPVRIIGNAIKLLEKVIRKILPQSVKGELAGGAVLAVIVPVIFFWVSALLLWWANKLNFYLYIGVEVFLCYQLLAAKSLKQESDRVRKCLEQNNITAARKALSYIVGRDTDKLNEKQIVVATVETIAENTSDGVVAPLFYLMIGGAPLCFCYKAINTLDSMVGYRNEKYEQFGKASAIFDDLANFIPSRISGMLMLLAAKICGYDYKNAVKIYRRDKRNHASPNSGQTEAVCSGALGIELGGGGSYNGIWKTKQTIGDPLRLPSSQDINSANKLMIATTVLATIVFSIVRGAIILTFWR